MFDTVHNMKYSKSQDYCLYIPIWVRKIIINEQAGLIIIEFVQLDHKEHG